MSVDVIAVFDIGKTNKKVILFDNNLKVVLEESLRFSEIPDDDGFLGDDIGKIEVWIEDTLMRITNSDKYNVQAVNFSTHGATVIYLDSEGNRLTPMYNYLKDMPTNISEKIYSENGGVEEFSRKTASPAFGFLNSGLQIKWLEETKPEVYSKVANVLHYQQYLSYRFTKQITSEFTSIGAHTMLWDFDSNQYHTWVKDFNFDLPEPLTGSTVFENEFNGKNIKFGVGMHDSSAALVPYLVAEKEEFILISTGTWGIVMNPFNSETLTAEQLNNDCLCFMSYKKNQVKSSLFLLGLPHEVNSKVLTDYFNLPDNAFVNVKLNETLLEELQVKNKGQRIYFKNGIPKDSLDETVDPTQFSSYEEAYHQLIIDLTDINIKYVESVTPQKDNTKKIFVTGGFAKNEIYLSLLANHFSNKELYVSEIDNASALGCAAVIRKNLNNKSDLSIDLGLKIIKHK